MDTSNDIMNPQPDPDKLIHALLYEGYALYPYHRSAIKNQKPIPFGLIYPEDYNACDVHAHSKMQTQCIVTAGNDLRLDISVRFLHLVKTELYQSRPADANNADDFIP